MASTLAHSLFLSRLPPWKPLRPLTNPCSTKPRIARIYSLASLSSSSWEEREESRWSREEQRWLREEQRWLREERRWKEEREKLLTEIAGLRMRIEMVEKDKLSKFEVEVMRPILAEKAEVKEMIFEEAFNVEAVKETVKELEDKRDDKKKKEKEKAKEKKKTHLRSVLRMGMEGDDVQAMQEALQKLGFYSGEEDMEFSSFSTGTERAVKTWQASLDTREDGIMTSELLQILFSGNEITDMPLESSAVNGTVVKSVTEIEETVIKEKENNNSGAEGSTWESRVFLLGENRWEDRSRLVKTNTNNKTNNMKNATRCTSCNGEGKLMCIECDGSGEPNIEPQFMEWVDEEMKCPYCDGLGYTICDICEGRTPVQS